MLDLAAWARDAFALSAPTQVLCRADCAGLCPVCAADLNEAGPEHHHEREPDPRWAKLRELKLELPAAPGRPPRLLAFPVRWQSPSKSSRTAAPPSGARSTRSPRPR